VSQARERNISQPTTVSVLPTATLRERERDREREGGGRERQRQTDRQTERQRQREREREVINGTCQAELNPKRHRPEKFSAVAPAILR